MAFADTDEGRALRESVAGYVDRHFPVEHVRARYDGAPNHADASSWQKFASDLGLIGLAVPEHYGGSDAGLEALVVALEETGRVLLPQPFLTTVLATVALVELGHGQTVAGHVSRLVAGEAVGGIVGLTGRDVCAKVTGDRATLHGTCRYVPHGAAADLIVVVAHGEGDGGSPVVAVVEGDQPGLERTDLVAVDRSRTLCDIRFTGAVATVVSAGEGLVAPLQRVRDIALIALAAEQLGGARRTLEMAIEYAVTRIAFGQTIGSFQAIKHKLARVSLAVESSAAVLSLAAAAAADSADLTLLASTAKARASEAFVLAASENIQVHGGIGFTWEHDAHMYLKRSRGSFPLFGAPSEHYARIAELAPGLGSRS